MAIRLAGLSSGLDTEAIIKELMSAQSQKTQKIQSKLTKLEWKQDKWKELNSKIYSLYTTELSQLKLQGSYLTKSATASDNSKATFKASSSVPTGTHTVEISQVASSQFVTGGIVSGKNDEGEAVNISSSTKLTSVNLTSEGGKGTTTGKIAAGTVLQLQVGSNEVKEFTVEEGTTVSDLAAWFKESDISFNYDSANQRFFLSSKESGSEHAFTLTSSDGGNALDLLGIGELTKDASGVVTSAQSTVISAQDMICTYNNNPYTSSSNTITINGLTINALDKTDGAIKVTVSNDTTAVYNTIKNFVTKYNEILKELNDNYSAKSARGYDVLTDEEREAMTDDQIEKWESKIKDSLLRRDGTLSSLISTFQSITAKSVEVNGKEYSLSSFGICTTDYTENGLLHIYGNAEDDTTADKEDLLMKALADDPDTVMQVFTTIGSELYSTLGEQMSATSLSSALTFYNDKEMATLKTQYEKELSEWEAKLKDMEDRYYAKFSAMETAISKLNSQTSYISSLFTQ